MATTLVEATASAIVDDLHAALDQNGGGAIWCATCGFTVTGPDTLAQYAEGGHLFGAECPTPPAVTP